MVDQFQATTGLRRRRKTGLEEAILAEAETLPARRQLEQQIDLQERSEAETERANRASMDFRRKELAAAQEQAKKAQTISAVTTGVEAGALVDKVTGGAISDPIKKGLRSSGEALGLIKPLPTGVPTPATGTTIATSAGVPDAAIDVGTAVIEETGGELAGQAINKVAVEEGIDAAATEAIVGEESAKLFGMSAEAPIGTIPGIAGSVLIEVARKPIADFTEEQIGTSAKHAANIATRAGQGFLIAGPAGAVIGAGVGIVEESWGWIEDQTPVGQATDWLDEQGICIIVTACYGADSGQVGLLREYRDRFMDNQMLRGYYMLAERIVPLMKQSPEFMEMIKTGLVDRWIKYAEYHLGCSDKPPRLLDRFVSEGFLALCHRIGKQRVSYMRVNGEVF
jgi:hypothetical protein